MSREAMKQPEALHLADALDDEFTQGRISNHNGRKAAVELRRLHEVNQDLLKALRQALEAEQEPVAWLKTWSDGSLTVLKTKSHAFADHELEPLYAAPQKREWVGLTDEQVEDEWERITGHSIFGGDRSEGRDMYISPDEVIEFSRAIEAKLKERNG